MPWLVIGAIAALCLAHAAPFPFLLEAFAPSHALWRVPAAGGDRSVFLTYDDGPNATATPALLDVLSAYGAHATFFLIDKYVTETTAPIVRRMFREGHGVALHADTRSLVLRSPPALAEYLTRNARRIQRLTGGDPCRLFRPHAGWRSGAMYEGLVKAGYRLVGWSWGLWDWNWYRPNDARSLARRLLRRVSPGDIVVMHDGHHSNPAADRRYAVEATRSLIPELLARGYRLAPLCGPLARGGGVERQEEGQPAAVRAALLH